MSNEQSNVVPSAEGRPVAEPSGRLGVLLPGLGAVASTFIAGVETIRQGRGQPVGSVTQLATIRLGKRSEKQAPLIKDFVPLANLDQLVFGAWDPIPDNAYEAAVKAGVLNKHDDLDPIADFLKSIEPRSPYRDIWRKIQKCRCAPSRTPG